MMRVLGNLINVKRISYVKKNYIRQADCYQLLVYFSADCFLTLSFDGLESAEETLLLLEHGEDDD